MMNCNFQSSLLYITFLLIVLTGCATKEENNYALIPFPSSLTAVEGSFTVNVETYIGIGEGAVFENEAVILASLFTSSFGNPLRIKKETGAGGIIMAYDSTIRADEGYRVNITPGNARLSARTPAGMFMAVQTVRQLLPAYIESRQRSHHTTIPLPAVSIEDQPLYAWRGIHLDVSRHFFSMDYLKKMVDLLALYKMNKFHLHLTDDQGWRIEIKKYPKLTEEGAWRTFNKQDSACMELAKDNPDFIIDSSHIITKHGKQLYGGYYTRQQLKEFVAYAADRHVEIIPEIDMPGHMMAAINAYHYLSCDGTSKFGALFSTPICPCNPATLSFAKDIFTEVMDIFPSRYIHIGGDEVDRSHWERSPVCQAFMKEKGFSNSAELQAWFIREMEKFFQAHGKTLIGWDEILEGGVSTTATIMYWRAWVPDAPVKAARQGNKVIMASQNPLYFSEGVDKNSLPAVYRFNPVPEGLTNKEAANIIGAQACLWTEQVPTEQRADYLYMPRITALSEALWSDRKAYNDFLDRLQFHYNRLDSLQVSYRLPDLALMDNYVFTDTMSLPIPAPLPGMTIHYTTDGSVPTETSATVQQAYHVQEPRQLRFAAFKNGRRGELYDVTFRKQVLATAENIDDLQNGLLCHWYKKAFDSTVLIKGNPDGNEVMNAITVPAQAEASSFTLQFRGYLDIPSDGIYSFYLTSDDAAVLNISGREVVNNDGMHAPRERNGQVALAKGLQPFALDFIEGGGGYTLKLQYSVDGSAPQDIPAAWWKYR